MGSWLWRRAAPPVVPCAPSDAGPSPSSSLRRILSGQTGSVSPLDAIFSCIFASRVCWNVWAAGILHHNSEQTARDATDRQRRTKNSFQHDRPARLRTLASHQNGDPRFPNSQNLLPSECIQYAMAASQGAAIVPVQPWLIGVSLAKSDALNARKTILGVCRGPAFGDTSTLTTMSSRCLGERRAPSPIPRQPSDVTSPYCASHLLLAKVIVASIHFFLSCPFGPRNSTASRLISLPLRIAIDSKQTLR